MIQERRLVIHNGCQHRDRDICFVPGSVTAVTGHNGCGKTNFLQLNAYAITGIVDRSWGSQQQMNTDGTKDGYVEVYLYNIDDSNLIKIHRSFSTGAKNPDKLFFGDNTIPDIVGRERVNEYLEGVLGVPMSLVADLLWMRQGKITWLLTAQSTAIQNTFNSIFSTTKLKKLKDILLKVSQSIQTYHVDPKEKEALQNSIIEYNNTINNNSVSTLQEQLKGHQAIFDQLKSSATGYSQDYISKLLMDLEGRLQSKQETVDYWQRQLEDAQKNPAEWLTDEHVKFLDQYNKIADDLNADELALDVAKTSLESYEKQRADKQRELDRCHKQLDDARSRVALYSEAHSCPLCNNHHLPDEYHKNVNTVFGISQLENEINGVTTELVSSLTVLDGFIKDSAKKIAGLEPVIKEYREFIKNNLGLSQKISEAVRQVERWKESQKNVDQMRYSCEQTKQDILYLEGEIVKTKQLPVISDDIAQKLNQEDLAIKSISDELLKEMTHVRVAKEQLDLSNNRLTEISNVEKINENSNLWYSRIIAIREGTQNDHIPARYLKSRIDLINEECAALCRAAGINYTIFLDPDDFIFRFEKDGKIRSAAQLSGAQQTLCATIVQLAIIRVSSPKLGLIMLDEPTVFLDEENSGRLTALMQSMQSSISSTSTVMLMPTHDQNLVSFCNQRIQLC